MAKYDNLTQNELMITLLDRDQEIESQKQKIEEKEEQLKSKEEELDDFLRTLKPEVSKIYKAKNKFARFLRGFGMAWNLTTVIIEGVTKLGKEGFFNE